MNKVRAFICDKVFYFCFSFFFSFENVRTDRQTDRQTDEWTDEWTDGRTDATKHIISLLSEATWSIISTLIKLLIIIEWLRGKGAQVSFRLVFVSY